MNTFFMGLALGTMLCFYILNSYYKVRHFMLIYNLKKENEYLTKKSAKLKKRLHEKR